MARPRKQTYTLEMYLKKMKNGDIDNSADTQRLFAWKPEHINGLIVTVLTDDYIPPIILGEEPSSQLHIADGGCRSAALMMFRYGNYKITKSIEDSVIPYKKKDKNEDGEIVWNDETFDIKNKTFDQLPDELKKKFDEYQIETVIHEDCDRLKISKYVKRYNNHVAMNTNQKAFVYISKFAGRIRKILDRQFFVNYSSYTEAEKNKGVAERVVMESVMCMFHLDEWKRQPKQIASYLNENAKNEEFDKLNDNLRRLENIITDDTKDIFNSKDSFVWLTLFNRFIELGFQDSDFANFLKAFKNGLRNKAIEGKLFDTVDKDAGTKDKAIIRTKLHIIETLMNEFLHINKVEISTSDDLEKFISELIEVNANELHENMDMYVDMLDSENGLKDKCIRDGSKLLDRENNPSLLAMVAYAEKREEFLDEWLIKYAEDNNMYFLDQKQNFLHMKKSFDEYLEKGMDVNGNE